jgi:hypothetical protein
VVDEPNHGLLVVGRVNPKDVQAGAVVDGGVLVVALLLPGLPFVVKLLRGVSVARESRILRACVDLR